MLWLCLGLWQEALLLCLQVNSHQLFPCHLLHILYSFDSYTDSFVNHLGIGRETETNSLMNMIQAPD